VTPPPRYHIYYYTAPRSSGYALEAATHPRRRPPRVRVPLAKPADELQKKKEKKTYPIGTTLSTIVRLASGRSATYLPDTPYTAA
jgi:hypothetical protein